LPPCEKHVFKEKKLWQKENKILDNMHHEKVIEVEKLNTTMAKLEEEFLASWVAINATWDYCQQVEELLVNMMKLQS
jgi:hypothetical protein